MIIIMYGLEFKYSKSIHWMKTNMIALVITYAIVEPAKMSLFSLAKTLFNRRTDVWDWVQPINQPIRIRSYGTNNAAQLEKKLFDQRQSDPRYVPLNLRDLRIGYETSMKAKKIRRTIRVVGAHTIFMVLGVLIAVFEQTHDLQMFNKSGRQFFSDFNEINSLKELDSYLRNSLVDKYYSADENGAQRG